MLLVAIIVVPLLFALGSQFLLNRRTRPWFLPAAAFIHLGLVIPTLSGPQLQAGNYLALDPIGRLVLLVISLLFAATSIYALGYFKQHYPWRNKAFILCLLIFLSANSLAAMTRHLGLLWVAVEATTLVSAPLIYHNRNRFSIEATWKYLILCSIGIGLALLGIFFIAYAGLLGTGSSILQFDQILVAAPGYSRPWLRVGFVFLLVGFGTKMGLAPLHSWKPDAYGEAPGMVGGLLAGGLTSVAFLGVLRAMQIMAAAGELQLARQALLGLGVTSVVVAALFVIRQRDVKRLLAYSSVEHMGLLAIGVGIGGSAGFGAMYHLLNNALAKGVLFMTAGNLHRYYGSKRACEIQGSMNFLPCSSGLFLAGFLAVTGSPPFAPFLSEFTMLRGIFAEGHYWLGGSVLFLLAVIFIGIGATILQVTMGPAMAEKPPECEQFEDSFLTVFSPFLLMGALLVLGLWLPEPLRRLFSEAAALLEAGA